MTTSLASQQGTECEVLCGMDQRGEKRTNFIAVIGKSRVYPHQELCVYGPLALFVKKCFANIQPKHPPVQSEAISTYSLGTETKLPQSHPLFRELNRVRRAPLSLPFSRLSPPQLLLIRLLLQKLLRH